jgi:hypothetical protein
MKNRKRAESQSRVEPEKEAETEPSLGGEIRGKIGQQLRDMYNDVVAQGVPGRFVDLLNRLEKQNKN